MSHSLRHHGWLSFVIAFQCGLVNQKEMKALLADWSSDTARLPSDVIRQHKLLDDSEIALLEVLVDQTLQRNHGDPHAYLKAHVTDPSLQAELAKLAASASEQTLPFAYRATELRDAPSASCPTSPAGATEARFRIVRLYAEGGLGQVMIAYDNELRRVVAVKELKAQYVSSPMHYERFVREARITSVLEHPGVLPVYGLGDYPDGRPFYAMRLARGDTLHNLILGFHLSVSRARADSEQSLRLRELLRRLIDVCNVIAYAHQHGVVHRDLKPSNIMVGKFGETLVVDWGLAKVVDHDADTSDAVTREFPSEIPLLLMDSPGLTASVIGTPGFMSPEQAAMRNEEVGPLSDVYSIGATMYAILTGRPPISEPELPRHLEKVQRGEFPTPRQVRAECPAELEAICLTAMKTDPAARYRSALAVANDIERWLADEPVSVCRPSLQKQMQRFWRKWRRRVIGGIAVAGAGILIASSLAVISRASYELRQAMGVIVALFAIAIIAGVTLVGIPFMIDKWMEKFLDYLFWKAIFPGQRGTEAHRDVPKELMADFAEKLVDLGKTVARCERDGRTSAGLRTTLRISRLYVVIAIPITAISVITAISADDGLKKYGMAVLGFMACAMIPLVILHAYLAFRLES